MLKIIAVLVLAVLWVATVAASLFLSFLTVYGGYEFGARVLGWW